jgi:prevent-host-death family protein
VIRVSVDQLRPKLGEYVRRCAADGEAVEVTLYGVPVVRIIPISAQPEPVPVVAVDPVDPVVQAEPVVPLKSLPAENGENGKTRKNADSPPNPKIPKNRLTDEEKAERAAARKAKMVQERADARAAKVRELGGPLVQLPAIVLRDQSILPCTAEQAAAFLAAAGDEISVDVEHSGFAIGHPLYALRLVQLGTEHAACVLDPSDEAQAAVIRGVLAGARVLHAHSAHADLGPLIHAGLGDRNALWGKMYDTVHAAKLTDPAMTDSDESALKPLARSLAGDDYALSWRCDELRKEIFATGQWLTDTEFDTPLERSGWAMIPICEGFVRYAASDVMDCAAVFRILTGELR